MFLPASSSRSAWALMPRSFADSRFARAARSLASSAPAIPDDRNTASKASDAPATGTAAVNFIWNSLERFFELPDEQPARPDIPEPRLDMLFRGEEQIHDLLRRSVRFATGG